MDGNTAMLTAVLIAAVVALGCTDKLDGAECAQAIAALAALIGSAKLRSEARDEEGNGSGNEPR